VIIALFKTVKSYVSTAAKVNNGSISSRTQFLEFVVQCQAFSVLYHRCGIRVLSGVTENMAATEAKTNVLILAINVIICATRPICNKTETQDGKRSIVLHLICKNGGLTSLPCPHSRHSTQVSSSLMSSLSLSLTPSLKHYCPADCRKLNLFHLSHVIFSSGPSFSDFCFKRLVLTTRVNF